MKTLSTILVVTALLICAGRTDMALAQIDPDPDGIGIYFDTEATIHCSYVPVGVPFEMYLVLTNASATAGVAGWECRIEYSEFPLFILQWLPHNWIGSFWDPPNFMIGLDPPLPWSPTINLMTISAIVFDPTCTWLSIVPHPGASIPGEVIYLDAGDYATLITMHQSTGGPNIPVAGINCDCPPPTAIESTTWSGIKSVFR